MKPSAARLDANYPRRRDFPRDELLREIGWPDVVKNSAFVDTCAIRMSVALARSGTVIPGARMRAKASSIKGKPIEPSQARLSNILVKLWGQPERYADGISASNAIGKRKGVVSFFRISGGLQGHIDYVYPASNGFPECAMACQFSAKEVWFWPLQ